MDQVSFICCFLIAYLHAQGLKVQARVVNMSRAFVEGARLAKLTEEEVEQIWRAALSPEAGPAFQGRRDAERARASAWSTLQKSIYLWAVFGTPDHNDMGTGKWLTDACRPY